MPTRIGRMCCKVVNANLVGDMNVMSTLVCIQRAIECMKEENVEIGTKFGYDPDIDGETCNDYTVTREGENSFKAEIKLNYECA
jgi:hypothetical protein